MTASTAPKAAPTPSSASTAPLSPPASTTSTQAPIQVPAPQVTPNSEPAKKPGELKVSHHDGDGLESEQVHTVKIDREGNLTYDQ
jgi:hypothetical protein